MFKILHKELQRRRATKSIQRTEDMFEALGFGDLVEPDVKVEISTAFHEVFESSSRIVNPEGGGEKVFAFDAHRLVESMCWVQVDLYNTVTTSREKVLLEKTLIELQVKKLSDGEEERPKKLAGELNVCRQQLRTI